MYSINKGLFAYIVKNIKESDSFRRDIVRGLTQKEGKLYLTQEGLEVVEYYNLPYTEYSSLVEV